MSRNASFEVWGWFSDLSVITSSSSLSAITLRQGRRREVFFFFVGGQKQNSAYQRLWVITHHKHTITGTGVTYIFHVLQLGYVTVGGAVGLQ